MMSEVKAVTLLKMKVHPDMLMKTKIGNGRASSARSQSWVLGAECKMKVHPGMLLKTNTATNCQVEPKVLSRRRNAT
jgi:hypothetical protein